MGRRSGRVGNGVGVGERRVGIVVREIDRSRRVGRGKSRVETEE